MSDTDFQANGTSRVLVVLLHAFSRNATSLGLVREVIATHPDFQDADFFAPDLPFSTFSMARADDVLADLLHRIDGLWQARLARGEPYRRIVLVGHSMGALYARKVLVAAAGENADAPFEPPLKQALGALGAAPLDQPRPWAGAVERIVLLAGMNRGWAISHHMSLTRAAWMSAGVGIAHVMSWFWGRMPIIFSIRRGSPFITQLRIQWLSMLKHAGDKAVGEVLTVQLLGSIDDLVSPEDNIDLVTGEKFVYLDIPHSGHLSVIEMDKTPAGQARVGVFVSTLTEGADLLRSSQVFPADTGLAKRPDVTDVVFVIHGILDEGYWTHKIARQIIARGRLQDRVVASETSSYGYFPMLSFLRPGARQAKVEWLMDQYTEALVRYPNARFSFVGHSNGTYLLAKALQDYPAVRFTNVVFAGSVVNRDYGWADHIPKQVDAVLNFVATADWVVAIFPNALQELRVQDLGSAGHDGFAAAASHAGVFELDRRYVVGGHSAALGEAMWDCIAKFVLDGQFVPPPDAVLSRSQAWYVYYPAKVAPLLWLVGIAVLSLPLWWLLQVDMAQWTKTLLVALYLWLIWAVLTRV